MIATINGVRIGYDDQGRGIPLVMLHGFPHDRTLWAQQRIALGRRARCIVPDLRGFGESTTAGVTTIDQYADDVAALLDWIEVDQAVICGLSMGGYVAMAMWRRHPERMRGLVLCDTRATSDNDAGRAARNDLIALASESGVSAIAAKQLPGMIGKSTRARRPEIVQALQAMMERQPVAGVIGALEAMRDRPDAQATLSSVTVPTLIVVGDEDVITPVADARSMMDLVPAAAQATVECIPEAGHVTCYERPSAVTHVLAEFLVRTTVDRD
jgi:pimeloyl-ACP methyl ester carboxylesterase